MSSPSRQSPRRWGRRSLLKGVGASALATAAVVFGRPGAAQATGNYGCCHLACAPRPWNDCAGKPDTYIWSCTLGSALYRCCERRSGYYGGCNGLGHFVSAYRVYR